MNIRARDLAGNYANGTALARTCDAASPTITQVTPTSDTCTASTTPSHTVTASDSQSGIAASGYEYTPYKNGVQQSLANQENSYTWATLSDGDRVNVTVRVKDNFNHWSDLRLLEELHSRYFGPSVPSNLVPASGTNTSDNTPSLSWDASTDSGCSGAVTNYNVTIYSDSDCTTPVQSAITGAAGYTATTLSDSDYYWKVQANDTLNNWGSWSSCIKITIDTANPTAPVVTVTSNASYDPVSPQAWSTTGVVNVSWTAGSDANNIWKYKVWRNCTLGPGSTEDCPGLALLITTGDNTTRSYQDTGRFTNTTYYYWVEAIDYARTRLTLP